MDGIQTYKSEFLPEIVILIVTNDSDYYETLKPKFDELGYGFMSPDNNVIFVDGEQLIEMGADPNLFKFIEAHEVSHHLLGHDGPRSEDDEIEADLGAYILLKNHGYTDSIKLLIKNFKFRHGVKFDESLLEKVKNRMPDL
jgi:hypothetical protein